MADERDWVATIVHAVIGALVGAGVAMLLAVAVAPLREHALPFVAVGTIAVAVLAALFGDRFWASISRAVRWIFDLL